MDSFLHSFPVGRGTGEDSNDDEDDDFKGRSSDELDSEEEEKRHMEELLYYQLYFDTGGEKSNEVTNDECHYNTADLVTSVGEESHRVTAGDQNKFGVSQLNDQVNDSSKERLVEGVSPSKRERKILNKEFCSKDNAKQALKSEVIKFDLSSKDFGVVCGSSTPSRGGRKREVNKSGLILETEMINSETEIYIESDDEDLKVESVTRQTKKPKRNESVDLTSSEKALTISDASSDSSIFLNVTSEDDLDVHMDGTVEDLMADNEYLQKILDALPADCKWNVNHVDEFGSAKKSRYYNSASRAICQNCSQRGHLAKDCVEPRKTKACLLCGQRGHVCRSCKKSLCFRCNRPGHSARDCDRRRVGQGHACHRCNINGHFKMDCPDIWRQFHLTTTSNTIVSGSKMENRRKFCFNCAGSDHFGHGCKKAKYDDYVPTIPPFIAKYDRHLKDEKEYSCPAPEPKSLHSEGRAKKFNSYESELLNSRGLEFKETKFRRVIHSESVDIPPQAKTKKREKSANEELPYNKKHKRVAHNSSSLETDSFIDGKSGESHLQSLNLSSFAQNVKEKMLRKNSTTPKPKPKPKMPKKMRSLLQLSFIPLTSDQRDEGLSNKSQDTCRGTGLSHQTSTDISRRMLSLSGTSQDPETPDGRSERNFSRSDMKFSVGVENSKSPNGKRRRSKKRSSSNQLGRFFVETSVDSFIRSQNRPVQTSTPEDRHFNGAVRDHKLSPIEMLQLNEEDLAKEYYGHKQLRKARTKRRRRPKKAAKETSRSQD